MTRVRTAVRLKARPTGLPGPEHWDVQEEPIAPLAPGEVLVANRYISVSPSLRAQMDAGGAYLPPAAIGDVVRARGVGVVLESRAEGFREGDTVEGPLGSQSHYSGPGEVLSPVDPAFPLPRHLGVLGMTGLTASSDNAGGPALEPARLSRRPRARIAACGFVADYNDTGNLRGARNYLRLLETRSRMEGFSVYDFAGRYPEGRAALAGWLSRGEIAAYEHVEEGLERFPEVLRLLFGGAQVGKLVLKV